MSEFAWALARCEDRLKALGRPREAWKLLTVHVEHGRVVGIGSSEATELVLGRPLVAVHGEPRSVATLPAIVAAIREQEHAAQARRRNQRRAMQVRGRSIASSLAKPRVRMELLAEIAALEAMQDRALAWVIAEAAAVLAAAIETPELAFDAGRYYGRALEASDWASKLGTTSREKAVRDASMLQGRKRGGAATRGYEQPQTTLVRLAVEYLAASGSTVTAKSVCDLLDRDVPAEIRDEMDRQHRLVLPDGAIELFDDSDRVAFLLPGSGLRIRSMSMKRLSNLVSRLLHKR